MSRRAHPKPILKRAHELRKTTNWGYGRVAKKIREEFGVQVGESTIRDWVTYWSRGAA